MTKLKSFKVFCFLIYTRALWGKMAPKLVIPIFWWRLCWQKRHLLKVAPYSCLNMGLGTKWRDLVKLKFYHVSKNFIWPRKVCTAITVFPSVNFSEIFYFRSGEIFINISPNTSVIFHLYFENKCNFLLISSYSQFYTSNQW